MFKQICILFLSFSVLQVNNTPTLSNKLYYLIICILPSKNRPSNYLMQMLDPRLFSWKKLKLKLGKWNMSYSIGPNSVLDIGRHEVMCKLILCWRLKYYVMFVRYIWKYVMQRNRLAVQRTLIYLNFVWRQNFTIGMLFIFLNNEYELIFLHKTLNRIKHLFSWFHKVTDTMDTFVFSHHVLQATDLQAIL